MLQVFDGGGEVDGKIFDLEARVDRVGHEGPGDLVDP